MGYMTGYLRGILPNKVILGSFQILIFLSFGSILHLFCYRYEVARGTKRLLPLYIAPIMVVGYGTSLIGSISIFMAQQRDSKVAEMLHLVSLNTSLVTMGRLEHTLVFYTFY